jgi:proline-specific peptidase
MWTIELYLEELGVVRKALGLDRIHLLGQSWGGMLAMEYMLTRPDGIASLTIASSPASIILWVEEANRLRRELPPDVQETLNQHEAAGTIQSPEYKAATEVFYHRHLCRVVPYPEPMQRSFAKMAQYPEVYNTMCGPNEFYVIGTIKDWDITHRLGEIHVPTLITSGRYDEATPLIMDKVHKGIPGSEWVVFENSGHSSHLEEPERYMQVLDEFLSRIEAQVGV